MTTPRTLVVADKFPPVMGGIQTFAYNFAATLPRDRVLVVAPPHPKAAKLDADAPFEIIRHPAARVRHAGAGRALAAIARAEGIEAAWFPAATPRGLVAPALRRAGVDWVVSSSHGHELGWSYLPVGYSLVRGMARRADVVTYLTDVTLRRLRVVAPSGTRFERLTGGVDVDRFHPGAGGEEIRRRHGWAGQPVVVCHARLVTRKGQDVLIKAWPLVLREHPDALLLIVGHGPEANRLRRLAAATGVADRVCFTGAVPDDELPAYLDAADVFAMPSRPRAFGLDLEGLGLSSLEAAAAGLPVITGAAGGAPEVVLPGQTGLVVDGRDTTAVAAAVAGLLADPDLARRMGAAGRAWMRTAWTWAHLGSRLAAYLGDTPWASVPRQRGEPWPDGVENPASPASPVSPAGSGSPDDSGTGAVEAGFELPARQTGAQRVPTEFTSTERVPTGHASTGRADQGMVMTVSDAGEKPAPAAAEVTEVAGTAAAEQLAAVAAEPAGEAQVSARPSRSKRWVTAFSVIAPMGALFWLLTHQDQLLAAFRACRRAEVGWTLLAIAAAAMTYVAAAASLKGSVTRRLPFGQLIAVQVAGILPNQVLPAGVGIAAVQARYLRRSGLPMADAVASTAVNATVGMIPHALVLVVLIAAGHAPLPRGAAEQMTSVLPLVAAGLGLMALLAAVVPAGRRLARTAARHIVSQRRLLTGAGSRSRFALLWGGSAAIPLLHAACLCAVMAALNARFDPLQVVVIYLVASAAAALIPSPGGFGSLDAALTALLTGAAGAATTTAIAAVLGYRLLTAWLPMAPSAAVCGVMIRARLL